MEFITTSATTVVDVMGTMIDAITTTPILALCFTAGTILPIGIGLFRKLKHR